VTARRGATRDPVVSGGQRAERRVAEAPARYASERD